MSISPSRDLGARASRPSPSGAPAYEIGRQAIKSSGDGRDGRAPSATPRISETGTRASGPGGSDAASSDLRRVLRSFAFAGAGIATLLQTQPNARVHVLLGVLAACLAYWLGFSALEWAVLILTMGLVLVAEAVNSAIESVVDLASPAIHPLARQAKDLAAGAVLLSAIVAILVGLALFGPRLLAVLLK